MTAGGPQPRISRRISAYEAVHGDSAVSTGVPEAVEARRFVEDELRPAGAGDDALFRAQLLATELVTNAARHAQSPVDLTIAERGRVRMEARDDSLTTLTPPRVETPTRHRGLLLIEDLSAGGVDPADDGKVVWCELTSKGLAH